MGWLLWVYARRFVTSVIFGGPIKVVCVTEGVRVLAGSGCYGDCWLSSPVGIYLVLLSGYIQHLPLCIHHLPALAALFTNHSTTHLWSLHQSSCPQIPPSAPCIGFHLTSSKHDLWPLDLWPHSITIPFPSFIINNQIIKEKHKTPSLEKPVNLFLKKVVCLVIFLSFFIR